MFSFNKKQKLKKWCELIEAGIIKYRPGKRKNKRNKNCLYKKPRRVKEN